jgi:molybdate transport system ATP-binding protein
VSKPPPSSDIALSLRLNYAEFRAELELSFPGHGVTAIYGDSGAGKTTCLRLLAGLARGRGALRVLGEVWQDDAQGIFLPSDRRSVGYVFQEPSLFEHLDVRKNLSYGEKRRRIETASLSLNAVSELLNLDRLLDRSTRHLSGGERQRVAIARALLSGPRLLLMDEPLSALDARHKAEFMPYLARLRDELSLPIVYVSHALDEVTRLADELVLLEAGRVLASGPLHELLGRLDLPLSHADDASAVIEAIVAEHDERDQLTRVEFDGGSLWLSRVQHPLGTRLRTRILARDVSLAQNLPGPSSILNILPSRVLEISEHSADRVNVRLAVGNGNVQLLARVTRRSQRALELRADASIFAQVKSVALIA